MQVDNLKIDSIPKNTYVTTEKDVSSEDHIIDKRPTTGARIYADKLVNDVFTYVPKGMKGSRNSNFYEFLSLGAIPNLIGSAMLIFLSNSMSSGGLSGAKAKMTGTKVGAGVVLYAAGKWLGNKIINKGVEAKTGVDLDMSYKKVLQGLPEYYGDTNNTMTEFHKVFESVDFTRWDLLNKKGEQEDGNRNSYFEKIGKKMGIKDFNQYNAADQLVKEKIKETATKASAAKSISSYIWAALGCAIASQESFGTFMKYTNKPTLTQKIKDFPKEAVRVLVEGTKSFAKTGMGKGLLIGAAASSVLGVLNATKDFKVDNSKQNKSTVDYNNKVMEF